MVLHKKLTYAIVDNADGITYRILFTLNTSHVTANKLSSKCFFKSTTQYIKRQACNHVVVFDSKTCVPSLGSVVAHATDWDDLFFIFTQKIAINI